MLTEYTIVATADLPVPQPFRERCMRPRPRRWPWRRWCWYHAVDWADAHRLAAGILRRHGTVMSADDADAAVEALDAPDTAQTAVMSLLLEPIVISSASDGSAPHYINGQHRVRAMLDQGVGAVVIERNPPSDPRVIAQWLT